MPYAPKWNHGSPWCDPNIKRDTNFTKMEDYFAYLEQEEGCRDYEGQKAGGFEFCSDANGNKVGCPNSAAPAFGREARTDVEGCCFWGRGVIQTTGVCNFGKFNYFMGARAKRENRPALFGDIDFCRQPDAICTSTEHPELKWVAGLFYWMKDLQGYGDGGWDYEAKLRAFVDGGMTDSSFINSVSGIVNRGCHNPPCAAGAVDGGHERAENFKTALRAFGVLN
jgi:hypothetical protein